MASVQAAACGLGMSLFERLERQGVQALLLDTQVWTEFPSFLLQAVP